MVSPAQQTSADRPWTAWLISAVVCGEALVSAYLAISFLRSLFSPHSVAAAGIIFAFAVLLGIAVWLAAAAWGTFKGRRWPRAAILVTQAFLVVVGGSLAQAGAVAVGVAAIVAAGITLVALFSRATIAWMAESTRYPGA